MMRFDKKKEELRMKIENEDWNETSLHEKSPLQDLY
jgi:hypothetical protein